MTCDATWVRIGLEGITDYGLAEEVWTRLRDIPGVIRVSADFSTRSALLLMSAPALTILRVLPALEGLGVRAVEEEAHLELGTSQMPPGVLVRVISALPGVRQVAFQEETGMLWVRYVAGCTDVPDLVRACSPDSDGKPRSGDGA